MQQTTGYATTIAEACAFAVENGFPIEVRSAYSPGGNPRIARNPEELEAIAKENLDLSPISEISLQTLPA